MTGARRSGDTLAHIQHRDPRERLGPVHSRHPPSHLGLRASPRRCRALISASPLRTMRP
jgi:hypothetical protein